MLFSYYIASRLAIKGRRTFSKTIVGLAIAGIAISIAVMISSIAILAGFKSEIIKKVTGFGMHVQVRALEMNSNYESSPIPRSPAYLKQLKQMPGVKGIYPYVNKPCILHSDSLMDGMLLKGVSNSYDFNFLKAHLKKGRLIQFSDSNYAKEIVVSEHLARKMHLDTGDLITLLFIQEPARVRRLQITGIYSTGLEDYDMLFAIVDMRMLQKLNQWESDMVQGFEIQLTGLEHLDEVAEKIDETIDIDHKAYSARQLKPQIFDWLALLDTNVIIIIALMIIVSVINMITALLILILERTNMIGLLKALGADNEQIKGVFFFQAVYIIALGTLIGNAIAFIFYQLQQYTGFVTLDPELYYLDKVPLLIGSLEILLINAGAVVVCALAMSLPVQMIMRISPVKALRFD